MISSSMSIGSGIHEVMVHDRAAGKGKELEEIKKSIMRVAKRRTDVCHGLLFLFYYSESI